jgi:hypothetical protein
MNRKAQFFILFAVVFGVLILSTSGTFNFATSQGTADELYRSCQNYKHEVFIISNQTSDPLPVIQSFTNSFLQNKNGIELLFIYGNSSLVIIQNNLTGHYNVNNLVNLEINDTAQSQLGLGEHRFNLVQNITINSPFKRKFNITQDNNFFVVMRQVTKNETIYCG